MREYRNGKVYEGGMCISEEFGQWKGQPCLAERDPVRLGAPKGWGANRAWGAARGAGASGVLRSTSEAAFESGLEPSQEEVAHLSQSNTLNGNGDESEDWLS